MPARGKPLALAAIGIVAILWLGPRGDCGQAGPIPKLAMNAPAPPSCAVRPAAGCSSAVRHAYPAAELLVLLEDAYF